MMKIRSKTAGGSVSLVEVIMLLLIGFMAFMMAVTEFALAHGYEGLSLAIWFFGFLGLIMGWFLWRQTRSCQTVALFGKWQHNLGLVVVAVVWTILVVATGVSCWLDERVTQFFVTISFTVGLFWMYFCCFVITKLFIFDPNEEEK